LVPIAPVRSPMHPRPYPGGIFLIIPCNRPYLVGGPGPFGPEERALEDPPPFPYP
jgi:hypothetical protein